MIARIREKTDRHFNHAFHLIFFSGSKAKNGHCVHLLHPIHVSTAFLDITNLLLAAPSNHRHMDPSSSRLLALFTRIYPL